MPPNRSRRRSTNRLGLLKPFRYTSASEGAEMQQTYTAVVKQDAHCWIGWLEEVPGVNCQQATREELLESLRVTLAEAIEFNRTEARNAAGKGDEEFPIAV
jgi:predicted RNase H-like HicB family nuclease